MSFIREYLTQLSKFSPLYKVQLDSLKEVKVVPCAEVLTQEQIDFIKKAIRSRKKECFLNALKVSTHLGLEYCEGFAHNIIPIEHAFNKVGDKYIDVTFEFALKYDVSKVEYATCGEYSKEEAMTVALETEVAGGVFNYYLKKNNVTADN